MIDWLREAPVFVIAALTLLLPGVLTSWALRFRGIAFFAASVGASLAIIALSSIWAPLVGLRWGALPVAITALGLSLIAWLISRFFPKRDNARADITAPSGFLVPAAGFVIAAGSIAYVLIRGIDQPDALSQNFDSPFHVNAITYILQHGSASPFDMGLAYHSANPPFYPTLWHAFVSLVALFSGANAFVATNVSAIVVSALVWPLAMMFLSKRIFPDSQLALLFAGVLTPLFATFPYRFLSWGLLYPNLLSNALVPIALGFVLYALWAKSYHGRFPLASVWIAAIGTLGAAILAHPNAAFALALLLFAPLTAKLIELVRSNRTAFARTVRIVGIVATLVLFVLMWVLVQTSDHSRTYNKPFILGLKEGLATSPFAGTEVWILAFLIMAGAVIVWRAAEQRWLLFAHLIVLVFFAVSFGADTELRTLLTRAWYNDAHRLAALIPVMGVPLAVASLTFVASYISQLQPESSPEATKRRTNTIVATSLVAAVFFTFIGHVSPRLREGITPNFRIDERSDFVTPDEYALFERVAQLTPEDALIAANPFNGSVYVYSIANRNLLFPYLKGGYSADSIEFSKRFDANETLACDFINEWGITHIIGSSHPTYLNGGVSFVGLNDIDDSPLLTEIERVGDASLYTVTGCN